MTGSPHGIRRLRLALDTGHCLVTQDIDPTDAVRAMPTGSARSRSRT